MERRRTRTRKDSEGMYSITSRTGKTSTKSLLKKFGDMIFDADKNRGSGSGRGEKGSKSK